VQAALEVVTKGRPAIASLLTSCLIHVLVISLADNITAPKRPMIQPDLVRVELVNLAKTEQETPKQLEETPALVKRPPPSQTAKLKEMKSVAGSEALQPEPAPAPATLATEEPQQSVEAKPTLEAKAENTAPSSSAPIERSALGEGAGNVSSNGDVAAIARSGIPTGGGTAPDFGRGSGTSSSAGQGFNTRREAKPIQTARAAYPPLALRMGLEGDVALSIHIDTEGRVTKAEIIKSAGMGFDEEALKAVRQSRFEAAQKDGETVPAEFTYIYRFRLQR
jgi:TonB family protein